MAQTLTIGTRGSPLALTQANMVRDAILAQDATIDVMIKTILTSGDWRAKDGEKRLPTKALFATEIEQALINKDIDIAVHSMKDMDSVDTDGLAINHVLARADVRDCLILSDNLSKSVKTIHDLPTKCTIGTASIRRAMMIKHVRPDVEITVIRGNVHTRIEKVKSGQYDATFLAMAGLTRLGIESAADIIIPAQTMTPAACQGTIGIQTRTDDDRFTDVLNTISCPKTYACTCIERAVLKAIDGSCDTPVGVYARFIDGNKIQVDVHLLDDNAQTRYQKTHTRTIETVDAAIAFGNMIGEQVAPHV